MPKLLLLAKAVSTRQERDDNTQQNLLLILSKTCTLMCLSIGTTKNINFPFVPNGKFIIFRCPKILGRLQPHYNVLEY